MYYYLLINNKTTLKQFVFVLIVLLEVCYFLTLTFQEKNKNNDKGTEPETQKEKNTQEQNSSGPNAEKPKTHKKSNPYGEWQEIKQEVESQ